LNGLFRRGGIASRAELACVDPGFWGFPRRPADISGVLALIPALFGMAGYIAAVAVLSPGYQLFQAANNTAVMVDVSASERGVVSGMLNLSRNLGLITGAAVMGAVFALATAAIDVTTARAEAVAHGMRVTFAVAAGLMMVAIAVAVVSRVRAR
jgi:hypothetical protein